MLKYIQWIVILAFAGMLLIACQDNKSTYKKIEPAHIEHVEGTDLNRVIMSEKAMERLGIETGEVREEKVTYQGKTATRLVVDYSALIYSPKGETWVYVSPEPRVFIREVVKVDFITDQNQAVLLEGPAVGTTVATVGVAEIYGTDFEVGH